MNLEQYTKKYKPQRLVAERLGISQGMVSHMLTRRHPVSANMALRLVKNSNNEMTWRELVEEFDILS